MPLKSTPKDRAWGTRYDTLGPCTPPSPNPIPHSSSPSQNPPTSELASSFSPRTPDLGVYVSQLPKPERSPHHASIFVGSLPSHMEHAELSHLLAGHLSGYTPFKSVKVVRDTKGGVCAFIQCESPGYAAHLLHVFRSRPPPPFLGRVLRFEPARAFRTLLVSFRPLAPIDLDKGDTGMPKSHKEASASPELPSAMRFVRSRNPKFISILYNDEARDFVSGSPQTDTKSLKPSDPFTGDGLYFQTLRYDKETIRSFTEAFGPLESFTPFRPTGDTGNNVNTGNTRIYSYNTPCPPEMDPTVWEVKWEHRDDCVAALAVLRRVPHIAVVWAHHMNGTTPAQLPESQFDTPMSSPRFTPFPTPTRSRNHVYAFSTNYRSHASQTMLSKSNEPVDGICPDVSSLASGSEMPPTPAGWPFVHSTPSAKGSLCASASHENILPTFPTIGNNVTRPSFTDNDFPPLQGVQDLPVSGLVNQCQPPRTPPKEIFVREVAIEAQNERHRSTAKLPTLSSMPKSPESLDTLSTVDLKEESLVTPSFDPQVMFQGKRQDSTVPPTPEFSMPSIAPLTPSTSLSLPDTPHSSLVCSQVVQVADLLGSPAFLDTPKKGGRFGISEENVRREEYVGGDVDPTTIFVGGLDTISDDGWNETKLRTVFEKYGDIKSIQLVKPPGKKSAFAFVKYSNASASMHAVSREHNRIYDGRQIRVQLRDNNPQRNPWRLNRMRDRVPHFAPPPRHGGQGEFQGDPSFGPPMRSWGSCIQEQRPRTRLEQDAHPYKPFQPQGDFTKGSIHHVGGNTVTHDSPPTMQNLYGGLRAPSASTSVSVSPPPSVAGSQPAMSTSFSHQPGVGFYAPQPWLHSYPPYPYTFPMVPSYMGYQPSNANATSGQNGNTPPAMVQHGGLPPSGSKLAVRAEPYPPPQGAQPPLHPTGFIQGEHGTLIPVYQPEALDQYMSHTRREQGSPSPHPPIPTQTPHGWQPYPPMALYPYVYQPPALHHASSHQHIYHHGSYPTQTGGAWAHSPVPMFPTQTHHPTPPPYLLPSSVSSMSTNSTCFRQPSITPSVSQTSHTQYGHGDNPSPGRVNRREIQPSHSGLGSNVGWQTGERDAGGRSNSVNVPSQTAGPGPRSSGSVSQF